MSVLMGIDVIIMHSSSHVLDQYLPTFEKHQQNLTYSVFGDQFVLILELEILVFYVTFNFDCILNIISVE